MHRADAYIHTYNIGLCITQKPIHRTKDSFKIFCCAFLMWILRTVSIKFSNIFNEMVAAWQVYTYPVHYNISSINFAYTLVVPHCLVTKESVHYYACLILPSYPIP